MVDEVGDRPVWAVDPVSVERGVGVVAAGHPITVACADAPVDDVAEIWGTALCLPAARAGAGLRLPASVDPTWAVGVQANVAQASRWWGGDDTLRLEAATPRRTRRLWPWPSHRARPVATVPATARALCFTGGVDSFYSLLAGDHRPTHLLFVAGFDVDIDDGERIASVRSAVIDVAAELGLAPLIAHTDLRHHPRFSAVNWEHTHGAALAAVAHALHRTIGTLVIPPSYASSRLVPWGSHPDLDPRWGVPGRLSVEHGDNAVGRLDRVLAIADHPLVHRYLRVCWQNVGDDLNCAACEKCVRTMVMLAGAEALDQCSTFPDRHRLPGRIDALDLLSPGLLPMWRDLVALPLRSAERRAVDALIGRSVSAAPG